MGGLLNKGAAYVLAVIALFTSGLTLGYRLASHRYQALLATEQQKLTHVQLKEEQKVIDQERQQADQLAAIDRRYQQELEDEKAKSLRRLAEWRAAHRKLYIGVQPARCDTRLPASAAASRSDHDQTRAELSAASAGFLIKLTGEADQVVRQLSACQAVVRADRADATSSKS